MSRTLQHLVWVLESGIEPPVSTIEAYQVGRGKLHTTPHCAALVAHQPQTVALPVRTDSFGDNSRVSGRWCRKCRDTLYGGHNFATWVRYAWELLCKQHWAADALDALEVTEANAALAANTHLREVRAMREFVTETQMSLPVDETEAALLAVRDSLLETGVPRRWAIARAACVVTRGLDGMGAFGMPLINRGLSTPQEHLVDMWWQAFVKEARSETIDFEGAKNSAFAGSERKVLTAHRRRLDDELAKMPEGTRKAQFDDAWGQWTAAFYEASERLADTLVVVRTRPKDAGAALSHIHEMFPHEAASDGSVWAIVPEVVADALGVACDYQSGNRGFANRTFSFTRIDGAPDLAIVKTATQLLDADSHAGEYQAIYDCATVL